MLLPIALWNRWRQLSIHSTNQAYLHAFCRPARRRICPNTAVSSQKICFFHPETAGAWRKIRIFHLEAAGACQFD